MKFLKTLSIVGLALAAPLSHAQTWPARTVTWIVPFAAGGPTDAMARDIAEKVGKQIGQTVIIENAAGAGGTIGATKAARAQPDGYTFLVGHMGYMGAGPSLYKKLNYDPVKSFEAVFRFPDTPLVLLVEDAHWLDEPSWDALFDVLNRANSLRMFAVITSRFATIRATRPERLPLNLITRKLSGIYFLCPEFLAGTIFSN